DPRGKTVVRPTATGGRAGRSAGQDVLASDPEIRNRRARYGPGGSIFVSRVQLDRRADLAEDRADLPAEEDEGDDRNDRDEGEDEGVFRETLTRLVALARLEERTDERHLRLPPG